MKETYKKVYDVTQRKRILALNKFVLIDTKCSLYQKVNVLLRGLRNGCGRCILVYKCCHRKTGAIEVKPATVALKKFHQFVARWLIAKFPPFPPKFLLPLAICPAVRFALSWNTMMAETRLN